MAVKKYKDGANIECFKDVDDRITRCIDTKAREPFGRFDGEYDKIYFEEASIVEFEPREDRVYMFDTFCLDRLEDDFKILFCYQEKHEADREFAAEKEDGYDVVKYY